MRVVLALIASQLACGRLHFDEATSSASDALISDGDPAAGDAASRDAGPCTAIACAGTEDFMSCSGRCFASCRDSISQAAAAAQCQSWGGELASIRNQAEQDCVRQLAQQQGNSWIGYAQGAATLPAMGWAWTDGSPSTFLGWGPSEPNDLDTTEDGEEDCVQIMGSSGEWSDWDCPGTVPAFACVR